MTKNIENADDLLLEPLAAYKNHYAKTFTDRCNAYFDGLLAQSGVNAEENRRTVRAYDAERKRAAELEGKLGKYRALKGLLVFGIVLGAVLFAAGIASLFGRDVLAIVLLLVLGAALVALSSWLYAGKIKPLLKQTEEKRRQRQAKAEELLAAAWKQTEPLNALFEGDVTKRLIRQTVPKIVLDDYFDMRRYDYLNGKYGYGKDDDPASSTLGILTGEIEGNPFAVERDLVCRMGSQTYTGSIVIHWTTTHTDSKGNLVTEHHSQTLTASVVKPKPFYSTGTRLLYGNDAAPDLHFTRTPAHAEDLGEKERERKIKQGTKRIRRKQREAMEAGGSFTGMGNEEFDVLFGALDRDNEVQFRLLFTPLAQKNLLALLKDAEGYGDDFRMIKDGCMNYILSEHSALWDMDENGNRYRSYSVDIARRRFLDFQEQYFRSFYFDLAPLLSIPLYTQQKPREYLYKDSYPRMFTQRETEYAVNRLDAAVFAPATAATQSILKTAFLAREGESDCVRVTANAYEAHQRIDHVSQFGGDGYMHDIPVPWVEYLPVSDTRTVKLKRLGLTEREFYREAREGKYRDALQKYIASGYSHGILCCVTDGADTGFDETW